MVVSAKRFNELNFIELFVNDYDLIASKFIEFVLRDATILNYEITEKQSYRIDLISKAIYGVYDFFWILMALNSIIYVEEIAKFRVLKYVTIRDLETAYFKYKSTI